MKHTPGPWTVSEGPHSLEIAGYLQDGRVAGVPIRIGATGLAFRAQKSGAGRGQSPRWYDFSEQDKATARLIAAAPELLEALQSLFEHCVMIHKHWGDGSNNREADAAQAAARAAIAKATGAA